MIDFDHCVFELTACGGCRIKLRISLSDKVNIATMITSTDSNPQTRDIIATTDRVYLHSQLKATRIG